LEFNLTSTHLDEKGNLNKGRFNFRINKEFAACIYPIDIVNNVTASISILYSDTGEIDVSTYLAKSNNGYFEVNLENFHYSSPTIQIRLLQEEVAKPTATPAANSKPVPTPSATAAAPVAAAKKTTISCLKGKLSKKVTAVSPKCPAGYKKK
jgi:hypothetical protein